MRKTYKKWGILVAILTMAVLIVPSLVSCNSPASQTTPATASSAAPATSAVTLTVVNGSQTKTYSVADIKAMAPVTGWAGQISSTGNISGPFQYKGVALSDLLKAVGGITDQNAVRVSAKDGYAMTISYNQVTKGSFTVTDSKTGKETAAAKQPVVFIAYEEGGKALDDTVGPLRLGIMTSENQVTDGHWWVKWAQKIEVIQTQAPFSLKLVGAMTVDIDSATIESCSAIGCHGKKWTDDQGRVWEGVPLYYFVGKVDDKNDTHQPDAFDSKLADSGAYEIHILAADGIMQKYTAKEVAKNNDMIISYRRDGVPLPTNQWPLRLVGGALDKSRQIGQITTIKLVFGGAAATTTPAKTTAPPSTTAGAGATVLTAVNGSTTRTYSMSQFQALTSSTGYGASKNKAGVISGPDKYVGVTLADIIKEIGGMTDAQSVKLTASDNFTKTLTYKQVYQGDFNIMDEAGNPAVASLKPYILLAYSKNGNVLDAGVGPIQAVIISAYSQVSEASIWVKAVVKIEVISP